MMMFGLQLVLVMLAEVSVSATLEVSPAVDTVKEVRKEAYVTILYNIREDETYQEGFEIGVRVLGQSLRESGTNREYVVLCTTSVREETKKVLADDGWKVKVISQEFEKGENQHFNGFFLKLHIWLLEEYRRIVYLDSDAIVMQNSDELFRCGVFCASLRHSGLFNAGVLVYKPSTQIHQQLKHTPCPLTKKCGDQILLNTHFGTIMNNAPLFNGSDPIYHEQPLRLPFAYNGDIGMYYLNGFWSVPESSLKIIHYSMGPTKPTQWWTYPLFDQNWKWNYFRERLPYKFNEPSMFRLINTIPFVVPILVYLASGYILQFLKCTLNQAGQVESSLSSKVALCFIPNEKHGWFASAFPFVSQTAAYIMAFYCVPTTMHPKEAWIDFGLWSVFFLTILYTVYCSFLFLATSGSVKPTRRIRTETALYLILFVCLYAIQVCIPFIFTSTWSPYERFMLFLFLVFIGYVYGYFAGRQILHLWVVY